MAQRDDQFGPVKAALLPGAVVYGLIGWILVTNVAPFWAGLPFGLVAGAGVLLLGPLLRRFDPEKTRIRDAYRPAFYRFYLDGSALAFAYVYNYLAVGLFLGGWLFLMVNAFA